VDHAGPRALADIENGVRRASPGTYAMLETSTILAGGEPKEQVVKLGRTPSAPAAGTDALSRASTEELLMELRRRIIAPRHRHSERRENWDDGLDPYDYWPEGY
jgi:hypothetical protein